MREKKQKKREKKERNGRKRDREIEKGTEKKRNTMLDLLKLL